MERSDDFRERYGPWALVAGGSEGLGAAFAHALAGRGLHLVLVARRDGRLETCAAEVAARHGVEVRGLGVDLGRPEALPAIERTTGDLDVGLLVVNAAESHAGPFLEQPLERLRAELEVNCATPLALCHLFGRRLAARGRGGILLMSSLAGSQGAPFLAHYAATKAWNLVLAEGLWGELGGRGIDVLACRAGATRTPSYLADRGADASGVPALEPEAVVAEALAALGRQPSMVPGRLNRLAAFAMQRLLPRRTAIALMARASRPPNPG